jgi:hypothetical protein
MAQEVKIIAIHNDPAGKDTSEKLNDEYVTIKNTGDTRVNMKGWQLTDWRPGQQHIHIYNFPQRLSDNSNWTFDPGEYIFLMTGHGQDVFIPANNGRPPQFHLYWNKDWFVWNNTGDTACLYDSEGKLVSQLTVP